MHIRCERCSAVYELDESVLPPGGAPVQCTRCQHVFTAVPPRHPGETLPAFPAPPPAPEPAAPAPAAPPAPARAPPRPEPQRAAPARRPPARDPRYDTIQVFARDVRRRSLWRWLGPLLVLLAAGGGWAAWRWASARVDPAAAAKRREALALLDRDDERSLERAAALLAEAARIDPKLVAAVADRSLALALLAADLRDAAAASEAGSRAAGRAGEADRGRPDEEANAARRRAQSLAEESYGELRPLARRHGDEVAVARALAFTYALDGNAELAGRVARNARAAGRSDPWLDLAEGAADLMAADAAHPERALEKLGPLAAAHPELLRARVLLARAQAALGRREAAAATLGGVLAENGAHEAARRLRAGLAPAPEARVEVRRKAPAKKPGKGSRRRARRR